MENGTGVAARQPLLPAAEASAAAGAERQPAADVASAPRRRPAIAKFRSAVRKVGMLRAWRESTFSTYEIRASIYQPQRELDLSVPAHGPSWRQVALMITNCLVGAGVLGLPYALENAGWFGLVIIALATCMTAVTAKMLVWSFKTINDRKRADPSRLLGRGLVSTYDQLAEEVAGQAGGVGMKVLTVLECFGAATCYIVLQAVNWPVLLHLPPTLRGGVPAAAAVCLSVCALAFFTLLLKTRYLSYFASIGLVATASMLLGTLVGPLLAHLPEPAGAPCAVLDASTPPGGTMAHELLNVRGMGAALSLCLFAFAGHATFPEIYAKMPASERPHFDKAVNVGFACAGTYYCFFAALAYYFFGHCAADTLTLNLMSSSPLIGTAATVAVLVNTFFSFSIFCVPVVRILTDALYCHDLRALAQLDEGVLRPPADELKAQVDALSAKLDAAATVLLMLAMEGGIKVPAATAAALQPTPPLSAAAKESALASGSQHGGSRRSSRAAASRASREPSAEPAAAAAAAPPATPPSGADAPADDADEGASPFAKLNWTTLFVRLGVAMGAGLLAISVPDFGLVVELMGAVTTMLISFILPAAFYTAVHWRTMTTLEAVACSALVLVGFSGMALGLQSSLGAKAGPAE